MWRPDNWENPYRGNTFVGGIEIPYGRVFENGADAMLDALLKLAKESPTGTFTIDSKTEYIYSDKEQDESSMS